MNTKNKTIPDEELRGKDSHDLFFTGINYFEGKINTNINLLIELLIEKDNEGLNIFRAGEKFDNFDYSKGLEKLHKLKAVSLILDAGAEWPIFNFEKAQIFLSDTRTHQGGHIYMNLTEAERRWRRFNYEKGFRTLRKIGEVYFYKNALKKWKKEEADKERARYKKERRGRIKKIEGMPSNTSVDFYFVNGKKKYYSDSTIDELIEHGRFPDKLKINKFDHKKALDIIIEKTKNTHSAKIMMAGEVWKVFDVKRALKELERKNDAHSIVLAERDWELFDYKLAQDAIFNILMKEGKNNHEIHDYFVRAGRDWEEYNYEKGFRQALEYDKTLSPGQAHNKIYPRATSSWPWRYVNKEIKRNQNLREEILNLSSL